MSTDNIPPPGEGWIPYGKGPLRVWATGGENLDVGFFNPLCDEWVYGSGIVGALSDVFYTLRAGSEIARLNGLEEEPTISAEEAQKNMVDQTATVELPDRIQINGAWYRREDT